MSIRVGVVCFFFFFKQKTAYEMRISDWSSDVCSSDLALLEAAMGRQYSAGRQMFFTGGGLHDFVNFDPKDNSRVMDVWEATKNSVNLVYIRIMRDIENGRASRRERVCQYV